MLNVPFQEPQLLIRRPRDLGEQIRSGPVVVLVCDVNCLSDVGSEQGVAVDQGFQVSLPVRGFNRILGQTEPADAIRTVPSATTAIIRLTLQYTSMTDSARTLQTERRLSAAARKDSAAAETSRPHRMRPNPTAGIYHLCRS